jgi:predicted O-methyltransferase YrrM
MNKQFTTKWFTGRREYMAEALKKFNSTDDLNFLEIGCWEGQATTWFAENFPNAQIRVIDTFGGNPEHIEFGKYDLKNLYQRFLNNTAEHSQRIIIHTEKSEDALPWLKVNGLSFDFIYIDGSHSARDVYFDAALSWSILKKGGVMAFDDYNWHLNYPVPERPKVSIDAFLEAYAPELKLIHKKACVIVEKC